jgi:sugar phosphate isomerase/epimerase
MAKYAIQLYSLREIASKDFGAAIDVVGKMGWQGVEFAGFFDTPAKEVRERLDKWGLTALSSNMRLPLLTEQLDEILAFHKELGVRNIICSIAPDWSDVEKTLQELRDVRDRIEAAGFTLLYHNHNHEFVPTGDVLPIDALKREFFLELDTFWAWAAHRKMPDYIEENKDRVKLLHIKDGDFREGTPRGAMSGTLGEGVLPLKEILSTAARLGLDEWLVYESDTAENSVEQAEKSLAKLREIMSEIK